jgi:hypothetical protein
MILMDDLRTRLSSRVQQTTDGHKAYLEAVEGAFGGDIDYAQLIKIYGQVMHTPGRYRPAECKDAKKHAEEGDPDMKHVSISYVERSNLSMRKGMRRFTRLTNAFSKKLENHIHALALYFTFYNFIRIHKALGVTPAMAAGVAGRLWSFEELAERIEARITRPKKRGPYKKRVLVDALKLRQKSQIWP